MLLNWPESVDMQIDRKILCLFADSQVNDHFRNGNSILFDVLHSYMNMMHINTTPPPTQI